jgi:hypothetical protein
MWVEKPEISSSLRILDFMPNLNSMKKKTFKNSISDYAVLDGIYDAFIISLDQKRIDED